jgi:hypothetical protein
MRKIAFYLIILIISSNNLFAQNSENISDELTDYIKEIDKLYSADDVLINGVLYTPQNSKIKGSPYLFKGWNKSTIYVDGIQYINVLTKYDLIADALIMKVKIKNGEQKLLNLNKFQIDSFAIGDSLFTNIYKLNPNEVKYPTYLLNVYSGKISLLISFNKIFINNYNNISPYGEFSKTKSELLLYEGSQLTNIKNKKDFLNYFHDTHRKDINQFLKKNKIKIRKSQIAQFQELMKYCNFLTTP